MIDVKDVSKAYAAEFYRMFYKNFVDTDIMKEMLLKIANNFEPNNYKIEQITQKQKGVILNKEIRIQNYFNNILKTVVGR